MTRYVAFLRSVNVGGRTVKMDALRKLFVALGYTEVETFIASGNVVFTAGARTDTALKAKIEKTLAAELGFPVAVFVRTLDELSAMAEADPFPDADDGDRLYVALLGEPPSKAATAKLLAAQTETDRFAVRGREVYWHLRTRFSDSKFSGPLLEKTLGLPATVRNITTIRKMAAKFGSQRD